MYAYNTGTLSGSVQEELPNDNDENTDINSYSYALIKIYQEIEVEIAQKEKDIKLLIENELLLKHDVEVKQRELGSFKMQLVTEQDNFDNIEKALNKETDLLSATALGQEVLSNQTKFYLDQVFKTVQFQDSFDKEISKVNFSYENILLKFKDDINKQNFILTSTLNKQSQINEKNLPVVKNVQYLGDQLKSRIKEIEKLMETLNMEYNKKNAVLGYLKNKVNEIFTGNNNFLLNLEDTSEHEQKMNTKETEYTYVKEKLQVTNEELQKTKQNCLVDHVYLRQLKDIKNINNDLVSLQETEADMLQKCNTVSNKVSSTEKEIEHLNSELHNKTLIREEHFKLRELLKVVEDDRVNLKNKYSQANCTMESTKEDCNKLVENLEALIKQKDYVFEVKNMLIEKKNNLQNNYEETNELNGNDIQYLVNEVNLLTDNKTMLNQELEKHRNDFEFNVKAVDNCLREIQQTKLKLKNSSDIVTSLHDELQMLERSITASESQFKADLSNIQNLIAMKDCEKTCAGVEIERCIVLHARVEDLVEECQAMYLIEQSDLNLVKENFASELQTKQDELEYKKNELENLHKVKMIEVSDLNGDIIEGGRNEVYLSKRLQELGLFNETKKREVIVLSNAVTTLDGKLNTIAMTVAVSTQDTKVSNSVSNKSTVNEMKPPITRKTKGTLKSVEKTLVSDDSSSSGESMCGNDRSWRKKVITKQQHKKANLLKSQNSQQYYNQ